MMYQDEPQIRYEALILDAHRIEHRAELAEFRKLERLQRKLRVVRARLGLRALPAD
jgi:hypothetical protein